LGAQVTGDAHKRLPVTPATFTFRGISRACFSSISSSAASALDRNRRAVWEPAAASPAKATRCVFARSFPRVILSIHQHLCSKTARNPHRACYAAQRKVLRTLESATATTAGPYVSAEHAGVCGKSRRTHTALSLSPYELSHTPLTLYPTIAPLSLQPHTLNLKPPRP